VYVFELFNTEKLAVGIWGIEFDTRQDARMPVDPAVAETVERNVEDVCWAAGPALPDVISPERS